MPEVIPHVRTNRQRTLSTMPHVAAQLCTHLLMSVELHI